MLTSFYLLALSSHNLCKRGSYQLRCRDDKNKVQDQKPIQGHIARMRESKNSKLGLSGFHGTEKRHDHSGTIQADFHRRLQDVVFNQTQKQALTILSTYSIFRLFYGDSKQGCWNGSYSWHRVAGCALATQQVPGKHSSRRTAGPKCWQLQRHKM